MAKRINSPDPSVKTNGSSLETLQSNGTRPPSNGSNCNGNSNGALTNGNVVSSNGLETKKIK